MMSFIGASFWRVGHGVNVLEDLENDSAPGLYPGFGIPKRLHSPRPTAGVEFKL
jgi:hypothetical protein